MSTGLVVTLIGTVTVVATILYILLDFGSSAPAEAQPTEEPGEALPDFFPAATNRTHNTNIPPPKLLISLPDSSKW